MYHNFTTAIQALKEKFQYQSFLVNTGHWQGVDIKNKPEMATYELLNQSFKVSLAQIGSYSGHSSPEFKEQSLEILRNDIHPNLPWADDHFMERVCGQPINPGVEWANWPYNKSAAGFLEGGKFNHNYMERYWPKLAGRVVDPTRTAQDYQQELLSLAAIDREPHDGIYHPYGDVSDVVDLLVREPNTRQAYIPIFFPEDTGAVHGSRLPCTLGYHLIQRGGYLHIVYYLRSCDFIRHFRDDIYLTVRLLLWVLEQATERDSRWASIKPGTYTMHMTSLHMFRNDYIALFGKEPNRG